ncbi:hypothetical protein PY546_07715 [Providencia stuartii]|nr:hypothetical protein [Providencia stuartii]
MINKIQNYDWGSTTALTQLYAIPNPEHLPMAELWMGAHPKASSCVVNTKTGQTLPLIDYIASNPEEILGKKSSRHFFLPLTFFI